MKQIPFIKMHGLGNDYVFIDGWKIKIDDPVNLARVISNRNFGIGSDGLVMILPSQKADVRLRIFNIDGSEAETCGNALRCLSKYMVERHELRQETISIETKTKIVHANYAFEGTNVTSVTIDMGEFTFNMPLSDKIPHPNEILEWPYSVDEYDFSITCLSVGNPHCIVFVEDWEPDLLTHWGPVLEYAPLFPERTNVEFVEVKSKNEIIAYIWERGSGPTLACGSGACAAATAAIITGRCNRCVTVHLPGGDLQIELTKNNHVRMTGPAEISFEGVFFFKERMLRDNC